MVDAMKTIKMWVSIVVLLVLPLASGCGSAASAVSSLLEQCEEFATNELDVSLNEECRELQDFFESAQTDLVSKIEVISARAKEGFTDLVLLITDANGDPVTGLTADQVAVAQSADGSTYTDVAGHALSTYEGLLQSEPGTDHLSFSSLIDYSGSILDSDLGFVTDALAFVYENMVAIYRSEVVKFSSSVEVTQSYTADNSALLAAVRNTSFARQTTAMYDGLMQALTDTAAETSTLRLVILFTDGLDNDSTATYETVKASFQQNDIPVCVVGVSFADVDLLRQIAEDSGCFFIYKPSFSNLGEAFETVTNQIENLYRIRVPSAQISVTGYVRVRVTVNGETRETIRTM